MKNLDIRDAFNTNFDDHFNHYLYEIYRTVVFAERSFNTFKPPEFNITFSLPVGEHTAIFGRFFV